MRLRSGGRVRAVERIDDGAEADARVLDHLRNLGCGTDEPRETSHYLYFSERPCADAVAETLARDGWLTRIEACEDASWLVVATRVRTLTLELVRRTRRSLEALAAEHGGVYDGWEARAS